MTLMRMGNSLIESRETHTNHYYSSVHSIYLPLRGACTHGKLCILRQKQLPRSHGQSVSRSPSSSVYPRQLAPSSTSD